MGQCFQIQMPGIFQKSISAEPKLSVLHELSVDPCEVSVAPRVRALRSFSRKLPVADSSIVSKDRFDHCNLLEIAGHESLIGVHIRVMDSGLIVELVLYELEGRNSHRVEQCVICAVVPQ